MKLVHLLIISISILFLTYALHSYFSYDFAIKEAKKSASLRNEAQASNIMRDLDKYIDDRIRSLEDLTRIEQIQQDVRISNLEFSSIGQESIDSLPHTDTKKSLPSSITYESMSEELKNIVDFYKKEYDYDVISEIFITNQHGFHIISGDNLEYRYDDESWWKMTKEKKIFIGNLEYNPDYDSYALVLAYPILDDSNNFIGSMHVEISINDLLHDFLIDVDILSESKKNVVLIDNAGNVIYEKGVYYPEKKLAYFDQLVGETGTIENIDNGNVRLISYASSIGYKDFKGFDWKVVIKQDESVVLSEFVDLRNTVILSTILGIISAIALSFILSHFVTKPLGQLAKITTKLGTGDFDAKMQQSRISEINSIVSSFNNMESSLKKLFETEKKLAEANARVKNERLTAIGELAASMAHDMKNPLGTIRSGIDIIKRNQSDKAELDAVMQRIDRAISRMSHQVEDVLNYVRFTPLDIKPISVRSIIESAIKSIEIPKRIQVIIEGDDAELHCDEKKMEIVFINMILNSVQAIGEDEGKITIRLKKDAQHIVVEIEDTGPGIAPEVESDIFKPLVTTKQKGTGLGLASCRNIVEQHGGTISFRNNPTMFTVMLPHVPPE